MLAYLLLAHQNHKTPHLPSGGKSVIRVPKLLPAPKNFLTAAPGYKVDLFADNLKHPRMMAIAPNGDVFVVETRLEVPEKNQPHQVVVLTTPNADGRPTKQTIWSSGLDYPFGIQFGYGSLYVANTGSVVRWPYQTGQTAAQGAPETIISGIPQNGYRNHWTRNILFTPDLKSLYLTIGSEDNLEADGPRRAVIERYPIGSDGKVSGTMETVASGMRNPIGLAINPITHQLWANVVERDYEGDDLVPDFMTSVTPGGFYGWPYSYIGQHHDNKMPHKPALEVTTLVPDVIFAAHCTPIDLKFVFGGAVVAFHGSQNRAKLNGYKVQLVPFDATGKPSGPPKDLVMGWLPKGSNRNIYGRPAGVAVQADGSVLIADDWGGKIWRIRKTG